MTNRKTIDDAILECLRRFGAEKNVQPTDELEGDLGIDSIERVELASMVAKHLGAPSRRMDLDGVVTVADLGSRLLGHLDLVGVAS